MLRVASSLCYEQKHDSLDILTHLQHISARHATRGNPAQSANAWLPLDDYKKAVGQERYERSTEHPRT